MYGGTASLAATPFLPCSVAAAAQTAEQPVDAADSFTGPGAGTTATRSPDRSSAHERIDVAGTVRVQPLRHPTGQTTFGADRSTWADTPARSVTDMLVTTPGVTFGQGYGPRDSLISVRGSGARFAYGGRNTQVTEDGFPVTQPDGLSRTDLVDPHAYDSVDVFQGPASTLYGNYAVNGAIDFRTRDGAAIQGVELGSDFGSFGQSNQYVTLGAAGRGYDLMVFGSDSRGDGYTGNGAFNTSVENAKLRIDLGPRDRLVFKVINSVTDTRLPLRLSLNQFLANPYQLGCADAAHAAAGCATVALLRNGRYGATQAVSAEQAGIGRDDRRRIVAARWEHDLDARTTLRTQFTYDQRLLDQPVTSVVSSGSFDSYNVQTDLVNRASLGRTTLTSIVAASYDYMDFGNPVYNITPQGGATRGALNNTVYGHYANTGLRFQEDWQFDPRWHAVTGLGGTYTDIASVQTLYSYSAARTTQQYVAAKRNFFNLAPEASLVFAPTRDLTLHTRVGTAYGTPLWNAFFATPQGTYGNNTQLKSQTSQGIDLGADWHVSNSLLLQAVGFYEFYQNELVSQSAGVNAVAPSYTFNAPASQHRGVELRADWQPLPSTLPGARATLNYTYDNQIYTDYNEVLSSSTASRSFSRDGRFIPGVPPHFLDARLLYNQPDGRFEGLGGFVEVNWRSDYYIDNANLVSVPAYTLLNLDLHYDPPARLGWVHRLHTWFEVQNVTGQRYVSGTIDIADTLLANGQQAGAADAATRTGAIVAGAPRSFLGGVRVRF